MSVPFQYNLWQLMNTLLFSDLLLVKGNPRDDPRIVLRRLFTNDDSDGHGSSALGRQDTFANQSHCQWYCHFHLSLVGCLGEYSGTIRLGHIKR